MQPVKPRTGRLLRPPNEVPAVTPTSGCRLRAGRWLTPGPAQQAQASDDAERADDRPKRAAGHRGSLDELSSLANPDGAGYNKHGSHHTPRDDHTAAYARPPQAVCTMACVGSSPLRPDTPLRGQADLRPAPGARRREQQGRLHDPRVGRGARRAVRAGRRRARAAAPAPARPGAGPTRAACRWSSSRRVGVRSSSAATWRFASASSTTRAPKASCGCARSTPSWFGSSTSTSRGGPAPCKARRGPSSSRRRC